ncbi:protein LEO1 homolog [Hibiscus syriacus]|uniref:protein LEO1 homolog n=1 Tax=Hibiscus syriacus TaxID=106335 RepID=UPI0019225BDF|nr:protein LEO1 homolog [Hibiscus syriacus]
MESDGDLPDLEPHSGESEGERVQSSQEVDIRDQREGSEAKDTDSDEKEDYGKRVVTSRRREVIESGSERSEENHYTDNEDAEVDHARSMSKSPGEEKDPTHLSHSAAEIRDVFGASDDDEEEDEARICSST